MKLQKGFSGVELVTTSMFVIGIGLILFSIFSWIFFNESFFNERLPLIALDSYAPTEFQSFPRRLSNSSVDEEAAQPQDAASSENDFAIATEAEMAEWEVVLAELKTDSYSDEDFSKESYLEEDGESTGLTSEQQRRLVEIEVELAFVVDRHKSLRDLIIELGKTGAPRNHLRQERQGLERSMYILAFEYNRMVPGEIYPDRKIGRILEGVGWHFSPTPPEG